MSSADEAPPSGGRRDRHERRSLASLFSTRRVSSGGKLPTLVVNDELQSEALAGDRRSLHSLACSRNGSVLGSPTLYPRSDPRHPRLQSRGKSQLPIKLWL